VETAGFVAGVGSRSARTATRSRLHGGAHRLEHLRGGRAIRRRGSAAGDDESKRVKPKTPSATAPLATSRMPRAAERVASRDHGRPDVDRAKSVRPRASAVSLPNMPQWSRFPDGCPPEGHFAAHGVFYRLARANLVPGEVPGAEDWRLPLHTKKSAAYQQFDQCDAYSYSMFADIEVLRRARESVPWVRKKSIARVTLEPAMGRILETESPVGATHHEFWPSEDDLVPPAQVVEGKVA
jgi:hypothetical protein